LRPENDDEDDNLSFYLQKELKPNQAEDKTQ